jgi:nitronate monooxygenase
VESTLLLLKAEAGGHRGMFLTSDVTSQVGTFALVPQVVDAVTVPVIAAGGIADERGIIAALILGASAVQIGTAYLFCPESTVSVPHRLALRAARDDNTALTNVFTGRPARAIVNRLMHDLGPIHAEAPEFPFAATMLQPLRAKAETSGSGDFSPLLSSQAASLGRELSASELTEWLVAKTIEKLRAIGRLSEGTA